jgi:galactose mutarotase-like enzyme
VSDEQSSWVSLRSSDLSAEVDPRGAQLSTLRDDAGRDLLWDGNPAIWNGRAPLLFPIVGTLAGGSYRLGSKAYQLSRHGFARGKLFAIRDANSSAATFRLSSDATTYRVYPFHFELDIRFALDGPTLFVTTCLRNAGDEDLPASFGYHPAFRWPLPYGRARTSHFIEFASDEPAPIRRINADGLLTAEGHKTPISDRRLELTDTLFQEDVVILDQIRSRSVTYGADDGPRIRIDYPDAPYLGIWTKPGAGFICIEPWHGVADPTGFSGDFRAKPGVFNVAAGAVQSMEMAITLSGV